MDEILTSIRRSNAVIYEITLNYSVAIKLLVNNTRNIDRFIQSPSCVKHIECEIKSAKLNGLGPDVYTKYCCHLIGFHIRFIKCHTAE